jgi:hypothetical protein
LKTTVEIPDDLFRKAKAKAALEGIPLRDLVVYGLQLAMNEPSSGASTKMRRVQFPLIKQRPGSMPLTDEDVSAALTAMDNEDMAHDASFV